jgi:hypothetical protein
MNRFFASLAARAVGSSLGMQRRQPALFEPDTRSAAGQLGAPSRVNRMSAVDPDPGIQEHGIEVTRRVAPAAERVQRRPAGERWESEANTTETRGQSDNPEQPGPVIGRTTPDRGSLAPRGISEAVPQQRIDSAISVDFPTQQPRTDSTESRVFEGVSRRDAQVVVERARTEPAHMPQRTAPRAEPAVDLEPRLVLERFEDGSGLKRDSRAQSALPERSAAPEPDAASPQALTRFSAPETRRMRAPTDSQSKSAPAAEEAVAPIHVTIGRIEVRAVLPATAAPRGRRQPPPSLDDFLRRRGRGQA